jgi:O-antigen ligase
MADARTLLLVSIIGSSFLVYFLPGGLLRYAGMVIAIAFVGTYVLCYEPFAFTSSHVLFLVYAAWIPVAMVLGHRNTISLTTVAFSFGAVVITLLSVPIGQWLSRSDRELLQVCRFVAIIGTGIAVVLTFMSLQFLANGSGFLLEGKNVAGLAGYGAMLMVTGIFTIPLVYNDSRFVITLGLQFFSLVAVGGRAALLGLVVATGYYVLISARRLRIVRVSTAGGIVLLITGVVLYLSVPIAHYLSTTVLNDIVTGRLSLWAAGRLAILEKPVFGAGFQNVQTALDGLYAAVNADEWLYGKGAHNTLVRIGLALGIPGLILYISIIVVFFGQMCRNELKSVRTKFFTSGVAGLLTYGLFESLLIGGASARSFTLTILCSAGFWAVAQPTDVDTETVSTRRSTQGDSCALNRT